MKKRLKFSEALFWIIFSTIIISGFNYFIFSQVKKKQKKKLVSSKYHIKTIAQNQNDICLDVDYLAELLNLSIDKPTNLFLFDENKAKENLLSSPLIKKVTEIKKIKPNCIFVDYEIRNPVGYICGFENVAIDEEGYIFPINPFFPDMDLCKFCFDLNNIDEYKKNQTNQAVLILDIYKKLKNSGFADLVKIKILDASRLDAQSYGKRELIIFIEEEVIVHKDKADITVIFPMILRLALNNYLEQIGNYVSLRKKILKDYENQIKSSNIVNHIIRFKPKTIDLRISKLAFIDQ
jgi:hypothetical protein